MEALRKKDECNVFENVDVSKFNENGEWIRSKANVVMKKNEVWLCNGHDYKLSDGLLSVQVYGFEQKTPKKGIILKYKNCSLFLQPGETLSKDYHNITEMLSHGISTELQMTLDAGKKIQYVGEERTFYSSGEACKAMA